MTFASPWMLTALVAIVVPIWLHFRKREERVLRFPAVELLAVVAVKRRRRIRLGSLVLLATRVLVIAAIVLAASRPGLVVHRPGGIRSGAPMALVIVLDDSMSMQLNATGGRTAFDRGLELAVLELDRLRSGDGAALVLGGFPVRAPVSSVVFDHLLVQRVLQVVQPSARRGDLLGALGVALGALDETALLQREIVVITDRTEKVGEGDLERWSEEHGVALRVLDATGAMDRDNVAIDDVSIVPGDEGHSRQFAIEAKIANRGYRRVDNLPVTLEINGAQVAARAVSVDSDGSTVARFSHRFESEGMFRGVVRIAQDNLSADNEAFFQSAVRESATVLVVDGDYHPGSYLDEAFYLSRALETPAVGEVPIKITVTDLANAAEVPLGGNDVVFLAGVGDLDVRFAARLIEYVRGGGGLFVSAPGNGDRLELIESILPGRIRSTRRVSRANREFRIGRIDRSHPIFSPFSVGPTGLEGTGVKRHFLLEPAPGTKREAIIELAGGIPLLIDARVDRGRVLLLTTTIDREWTDLPIRPGFLPLVQRAARFLAGRLDEQEPSKVRVGQKVRLEVSEGMERLVVQDPSGDQTEYTAGQLSSTSAVSFADTVLPGHYRVWAEIPGYGGMKELEAQSFVVERHKSESLLKPVMEAQGDSASFDPVEGKLPVWPYLLIAVMLLLLFETWLMGQGLRRSHRSGNSVVGPMST